MTQTTRRGFLKGAAARAGAVLGAPYIWASPARYGESKNDRVNVAAIGTSLYLYHMQNFFDCMKDRSLPISDVFTHHRSVSACHLANIAVLLERNVRWDPVKEKFLDDDEANKMIAREMRPPWQV